MFSCSRNIVLRLALLLCAVAQLVVLMPHHHHGGSETPCFNALHCVAEPPVCPSRDAHAGCNHGAQTGHDGGAAHDHDCAGDECTATQITATEPRVAQANALASLIPLVFEAHRMRLSCPGCSNAYYTTLQTTAFHGAPPLERLYTSYIVRAIPGRAPTGLA
jgi:hypothetical protein